ncbi:MAG TPA: AAA family ATPase [Armatimonadaceae bacterium]|jgi:predicted ATPase|nr:AAA family ATPase [Armatimonadaceae bacterium]
MQLKSLTVRGYKSIRELDGFELRNLNVLIGANGAGKSNLISLFRLLAALANGSLQEYVQLQGGPDALLRGGRKQTAEIEAAFSFGHHSYRIALMPSADNRLIFTQEEATGDAGTIQVLMGTAHEETRLSGRLAASGVPRSVLEALQSWRVYHFHDTGDAAAVKRLHASNDNLVLKADAGNLAAYLARLKTGDDVESRAAYGRIVDTIRLAAPFFGDFVVREPLPRTVELEWTERGQPDTPLRAHLLSDGTLRFLCLTTLLLQPADLLPDTVLIDEPELGLHPYAINLLAEMLQQVAATKQVIVSTQSVELLNHFAPEDVIVVDRSPEDGASTFRRPDAQELADWLEDYTLGELWQRNILGGRPTTHGGLRAAA